MFRTTGSLRRSHRRPFIGCISSAMDSAIEAQPVEIVNLRAAHDCGRRAVRACIQRAWCRAMAVAPATRSGRSTSTGSFCATRLYRREALRPGDAFDGPAMITEYTSATALPPDCCAQVDGFGNLVIADCSGGCA